MKNLKKLVLSNHGYFYSLDKVKLTPSGTIKFYECYAGNWIDLGYKDNGGKEYYLDEDTYDQWYDQECTAYRAEAILIIKEKGKEDVRRRVYGYENNVQDSLMSFSFSRDF